MLIRKKVFIGWIILLSDWSYTKHYFRLVDTKLEIFFGRFKDSFRNIHISEAKNDL